MGNNFQAADRALQMLEAFDSEDGELGVSELAGILGIHRSTASRLAATLERRGFLERAPGTKTLRLGPSVGRLGLRALGGRDLVAAARPVMERLAERTGETVNLAVVDGPEVVNIAQVDGRHIVGVGTWTGQRTPFHPAANGKVLAAFGDIPLPAGPLKAFTKRTITSPRAFREELKRVRRQGWATNLGELEAGLHAVAAPVFDAFDRCRAALSVSGPSYRMPSRRLAGHARRCVEAALEIGRLLGRTQRGGRRA
jgi:DNA-binding IclR family transcriptional regulator